MIRKSTFTLKYANKEKIQKLDLLMDESIRVMNLFIDILWISEPTKFVSFGVKTWLSMRMQQCLGKQASEIVKSVRSKNKKTKPVFKKPSINLDSRFVDFRFDENTFDVWIRLTSLGNKLSLCLPSRKHKHYLKLQDQEFCLKKGARLRRVATGYEIDLYLEKKEPVKRESGEVLGLDCGYKKLLASSNGKIYDDGLEVVYEKIARKKQNSKAFKRALTERDNLINQTVNGISFDGIKEIIVEELKNVKHKSKGKIRKKFNNKLQRWSYRKVLDKLSRVCEELGIIFTAVNPAYTSQTCSKCGAIHKDSRKGEKFLCVVCGMGMDADYNAAINILHRGVYSPATI